MAPEEPCSQISINHVSLSVVDMEESLRFYTEFLGMERIPVPNSGSASSGCGPATSRCTCSSARRSAPQYHHVGFSVTNFEELYVRAKETGPPPPPPRSRLPDGGAQMYVRDPGGQPDRARHARRVGVDRSVVEMRRLVDAIPQSEYNKRATLFLEPRPTA